MNDDRRAGFGAAKSHSGADCENLTVAAPFHDDPDGSFFVAAR
jgi:hypothetical protein